MSLKSAFLMQAATCQTLGSPFTARLLRLCAENIQNSGPVGEKLHNWRGDVSARGHSVPLRLMGALHGLVLTNQNAALVAVYPPRDQQVDDRILWQAVASALSGNNHFILNWLTSPPQTNEPARSGALIPGFMEISAAFNLPLDLSEIGASAGLNQWWDHYNLTVNQQSFGPKASPLRLLPEWHGPLPANCTPKVRARAGCDLNPIDIHDPNGRLRLTAYIWPDQQDRLQRMKAAIDIAVNQPKTIVKADAIGWLKDRLSAPHAGAVHVIYNSVAWQYLPETAQNEGAALIAAAGQRASKAVPLAWLQMEADDNHHDGAAITLQLWPGNHQMTLGRADFHGRWVRWSGMQD